MSQINKKDDYRVDHILDRPWSYSDIEFWKNQNNGTINAIVEYDGKKSRLRAGVLIVKDDTILLGEEAGEKGVFSLPGGGLEKNETPIDAAKREAREEVYINIKDAIDTYYDYCECHSEVMDWVKENIPERKWWYNYYTCLILARYDSDYTGKVDEVDKDLSMNGTTRWYKIKDVINKPDFKKEWKNALIDFGYYKESLTEATRTQLISQSRNADIYKNQKYGKNRFERKKYSKVATQVKSYNTIDMNDFFKRDILTVNTPVTGETNNYNVAIKLEGVLTEIAKNIKANQNKFEFRTVMQSLTKVFNTGDVKIKCNCDDFKYRFAHSLIINGDSVDGTDKDPGPGKTGMANTQGKGCKHILLVLSNQDWLMKTASVINNYINYMQEHRKKAFLNLMFPKLYGVPASAAEETDLVPENTDLETDNNIIDTINQWGRNRGRFKKGANKNPVSNKNKTEEKK